MSKITIMPGKLSGIVRAPSSKSFGHRALICGALAAWSSSEKSLVQEVDLSNDITATAECLKALGFLMENNREDFIIANGRRLRQDQVVLNCGESGSTLRFLVPVAASLGIDAVFIGEGRLPERPVIQFKDMFKDHGVELELEGKGLPLRISGKLEPGVFELPGNISSQYISGLLMALPLLDGSSEIVLTTSLESKPYVDITIEVMKVFGVEVQETLRGYFVDKNSSYKASRYKIEGDYSQAAFWFTAGFLGSDIAVSSLNEDSIQGDKAILEQLEVLGGRTEYDNETIKVKPGLPKDEVRQIDCQQIPDLVPILAGAAALTHGTTHFINAGRLRIKESDRLAAVADVINALGGQVEELSEGLIVTGRETLRGGKARAWNDHRIAMLLGILALNCENSLTIEGHECINKSYPTFFEELKRLGGVVE